MSLFVTLPDPFGWRHFVLGCLFSLSFAYFLLSLATFHICINAAFPPPLGPLYCRSLAADQTRGQSVDSCSQEKPPLSSFWGLEFRLAEKHWAGHFPPALSHAASSKTPEGFQLEKIATRRAFWREQASARSANWRHLAPGQQDSLKTKEQ